MMIYNYCEQQICFLCPLKKTNIEPETKIDMPLWLADPLCRSELLIECDLPNIFTNRYREIIQADACIVELRKWNNYFYEFGLQIPQTYDQNFRIPNHLLEVFKCRFRIIVDLTQSTITSLNQTSCLEKKLLIQGHEGKSQVSSYLSNGIELIENSANSEYSRKYRHTKYRWITTSIDVQSIR
ncbi:uncharacterized protein LOC131675032 isoform X2 [Phymastichus coffea]|uniref:uncharacterized protein LOC131675032 isoform X2 n=1 Tax=Phymastichus coffea TaxID=108790 RepID=UPI00273CAFD7|nr:uncharacterized protein LOC131675032 isoform X2 [Phymastichus coffea]